MDKNAAANPQHIFHPSSLISHPLTTHHLNHAHYLHRMSRCQDSMFTASDSLFASAPRFKNPFQAAFEGLHHELGNRASTFPPSPPPPLVSSPQSRHTQAFYPSLAASNHHHNNSSSRGGSASPAPAHGTAGHRSKTKICGVCGDRAKSYHFGGISCDSCKAFFRRSVQNDAYKNFHCPYEGQCDINITSRKCCQYCRFKKCLSIGMERSWVMTEEERLQMLKSRLEKRQRPSDNDNERPSASSTSSSLPGNQSNGSSSPTASSIGSQVSSKSRPANSLKRLRTQYEPRVDNISHYLSESDVLTIETIINQYIKSCQEIPMNLDGFEDFDDGDNKVGSNRSSRIQQQQQPDQHHEHHQAAASSSSSPSSSSAGDETGCSPGVANSNLTILSARHGRNKITSQPSDERQNEDEEVEDDKNTKSDADGRKGQESKSGRMGRKNHDQQGIGSSTCPQNSGQMNHLISQVSDRSQRSEKSHQNPKEDESKAGSSSNNEHRIQLKRILHVLFTCIQQIASFALRIPSFQLISAKDQEILLRGSVLEMCFIRSGFRFDPQYESWTGTGFSSVSNNTRTHSQSTATTAAHHMLTSESCDSGEENWYRLKRMKLSSPPDTPIGATAAAAASPGPTNCNSRIQEPRSSGIQRHSAQQEHLHQQEKTRDIKYSDVNHEEEIRRRFILSASDIKPFISDEMFRKHMQFIRSIRDLDADQVTIILLSIIVLLNPDRIGLQDAVTISKEQERFLILLRSYMTWRYGEVVSPILFGKFFLKLPDLKELSEVISECQLCLGEEEVKQVYQRLSRLSLSLAVGGSNGDQEKAKGGIVRPSEDMSIKSLQSDDLQIHQSSTSSSSSSSCSPVPCPSLVRRWVFRIDAIPQSSGKSLSHASHQQEDDASRSCSSSPSESIASTDGPFSPS